MPEKRQKRRSNVLIYLFCLIISFVLWTIQTLNRHHEFWFRVQFIDTSRPDNPSPPEAQVHISGPGYLLVPFWLKDQFGSIRVECPPETWKLLPEGKLLQHHEHLVLEHFPVGAVFHEIRPDSILYP